MGIGRQQGRAALTAIRAGTNRANARQQVADAAAILQEWLNKRDLQDAEALSGFAISRPTQYDNFVDTLPEPTVDQSP
jgi:hypothetical protein